MANTPCYNCTLRQIGCHGKCQKYIDFRYRKDEEIRLRNAENEINGVVIDTVLKNVKYGYSHRRR